jgi:hypothetical protein
MTIVIIFKPTLFKLAHYPVGLHLDKLTLLADSESGRAKVTAR